MAAANYCLRGDLSEEMQVNDPLEDSRIDRAITDASRAVDIFCRQEPGTFAPQTLTRYFDFPSHRLGNADISTGVYLQRLGSSAGRLFTTNERLWTGGLRVPPLLTVTSLATDQDGDGVFETVWTTPTDYLLTPNNREVKRQVNINATTGRFGFPEGQQRIKIIGSWGITEDGKTPLAIRRAALILAMTYYRKPTPGASGSSGLGGAAVHIGYSDVDVAALLWEVAGVYREQWIGA